MPPQILILGTGIAGPVLSHFLSLTPQPPTITLLERSPSPRKTGQSLDIRGPAVQVMRAMGLEADIRRRGTGESGVEKVGWWPSLDVLWRGTKSQGGYASIVRFESSGDPSAQSASSEFEILRADLASIFVDNLSQHRNVTVIYGEYATSLTQFAESATGAPKVHAEFANGLPSADYDLVVGADGMNSPTRAMMTGYPASHDLKKLGAYCAYFTVPAAESDRRMETVSRYYTADRGRGIWLRPTSKGDLGAYLLVSTTPETEVLFASVEHAGQEKQKAMLAEFYADAGGPSERGEDQTSTTLAQRILHHMHSAPDFYYQTIAQVHIPSYHSGRIVLLGDAAHCPSPLSGQGTSCAMYGAYVLAGELTKTFSSPSSSFNENETSSNNNVDAARSIEEALQKYDKITREFVTPQQSIPLRVFRCINAQTAAGVLASNVCWLIIRGLFDFFGFLRVGVVVGPVVKVLGLGGDGVEGGVRYEFRGIGGEGEEHGQGEGQLKGR